MSERFPTNGEHGFSLLEVLVALALMAVIGVTMTMAVTHLRPMRMFEERMDEQQIASTLADVVARDLQGALRVPLLEAAGSSNQLIRGGPNKVTFTAVVPTGYERNGLREVTYEILGSATGARLVRTARWRRFSQSQEEGVQTDEIYAGKLKFHLSYLDKDGEGRAVWRSEFDNANQLPIAANFEVEPSVSHIKAVSRTVWWSLE